MTEERELKLAARGLADQHNVSYSTAKPQSYC
jgi:hypothetical protein